MVNLKGSCSEKSAKSTRGVKDYLPSEFEQGVLYIHLFIWHCTQYYCNYTDIKDFVDTVVGDIIKQAMLEANLEATKSEYILLLSDVYIAKHLKMAELLKVLGFEDTDTSRPGIWHVVRELYQRVRQYSLCRDDLGKKWRPYSICTLVLR